MPPRPWLHPRAPATQGQQEQVNAGWQSHLWIAASLGDLTRVRSLLTSGRVLVDRQCNQGASPLHVACQNGHLEVVRSLLSAGALVDLTSADGTSPLWAASHGGHVGVVRALLSSGAQVDLVSSCYGGGTLALLVASFIGHVDAVRTLLSAGARVDLQNIVTTMLLLCVQHARQATWGLYAPLCLPGPR